MFHVQFICIFEILEFDIYLVLDFQKKKKEED